MTQATEPATTKHPNNHTAEPEQPTRTSATTQTVAPTPELKGKIIDVVEKGYKLGEKIIRYPKVVVGQ